MPTQAIYVKVELALPEGKETYKDCNNAELAAAMNQDLDVFNKYMVSLEQDRLVPAERTLLKTYLAWKILHAPNAVSTKD